MGLLLALIDAAIESPHAHIIVLPADHGFADEALLARTIDAAFAEVAERPDHVMLLAAEPDRAATDYGWIVPRGADASIARPIERFAEKPDRKTAAQLFADGAAWSTMMMLGTARGLLAMLERHVPALVRMFLFHAALPGGEKEHFLERAYDALRPLDLSADILENDDRLMMLTLPREAGWSDLGTEERMLRWIDHREGQTMPPSGVHKAGQHERGTEVA